MTILVTGGTGIVGSRLLRRLADAGVDCRALVRAGKKVPAGVTPVEGDILDPESLPQAVQGVSAIIHLAALLRSPDTAAIWKVNLEGTRNLIATARLHAPEARFIMASTGLVYNPDIPRPARENDPAAPTAAYPASKLAAENELRASGLTWSVLRLGFVYGDGDGHLESAQQLFSARKWHPAQTLSLLHQRDVATAVELALTGATDGRVVNIVDEAPTTVYEIASIVGATMEPSADPLPNPWMGRADGSLARSLGFQPTVRTVYQASREGAL
ncbi:MAG: NAD(P)-dependent oxidoreductase [Actinobacteria bacterium]|nr:NAD(P)-dependent oxidoreductase [Actinomycetota bacterium]